MALTKESADTSTESFLVPWSLCVIVASMVAGMYFSNQVRNFHVTHSGLWAGSWRLADQWYALLGVPFCAGLLGREISESRTRMLDVGTSLKLVAYLLVWPLMTMVMVAIPWHNESQIEVTEVLVFFWALVLLWPFPWAIKTIFRAGFRSQQRYRNALTWTRIAHR